MKKNLLNPGFELIFSACIILCLVVPTVLMAQDHKELKVMITNGDTTINGKNIKALSATEHKEALKEIGDMGKDGFGMRRRNGGPDGNGAAGMGSRQRVYAFKLDSTSKGFGLKREEMRVRMDNERGNARDNERPAAMNFRRDNGRPDEAAKPRWGVDMHHGPMGGPHRNMQNFSYSTTNNDGISTRVNYTVSDVNRENAKKISGVEKADLALNDLVLLPSFTTGKTMLSFTLAEKGSADIEFKTSDGKVLWTDKTNSAFSKSFELPQNGIYYLQVKQNGKVSLRRILKDE